MGQVLWPLEIGESKKTAESEKLYSRASLIGSVEFASEFFSLPSSSQSPRRNLRGEAADEGGKERKFEDVERMKRVKAFVVFLLIT